jgi:hypothetical protein
MASQSENCSHGGFRRQHQKDQGLHPLHQIGSGCKSSLKNTKVGLEKARGMHFLLAFSCYALFLCGNAGK